MSRSRKKPIYKDVGFQKKDYWKVIRREWSQTIKGWRGDELYLRKPKSIINDYNYSDYSFYCFPNHENDPFQWSNEQLAHYKRK